jgi:hypothetical protein
MQGTLCYRVGSKGIILQVNQAWTDFAIANATPELAAERVCGQPLERYIHGMEARELWRMLLERVRAQQTRVVLPFRCDAPELRRFMEMTVTARDGGDVDFATRLLRAERRAPVALLAQPASVGADLLPICSWCKQVRLEDGTWVEVELAIERLDLFGLDSLPQLTHGICPRCFDVVMQTLRNGHAAAG